MTDLGIAGGAYSMDAPIAVQECINLYPEMHMQEASSTAVLRRFPGLKLFSSINNGKIRGMATMGGTLYVVSGTSLYSVDNAGTATSIGTIAGTSLVSMAADRTNLVIANGTATGYVYDGSTLTAIADVDFQSADIVLYLDTYFVFHSTATNQFFISAAGDPTSYTATDFASKEGKPDDIVAMIASHRDLILFGSESTETYRNTGNPDFPFQRQNGTFQERGAIGRLCPQEMDNTVFFLGDDRIVYRLDGYRPVRISHHAIEKWLDEQEKSVLDNIKTMTISHQGHYWYVMNFSTGTWVYDATTSGLMQKSQWFQLKSWQQDRWRVDVIAKAYGKTYCGDASGNVYELDDATLTENGQPMMKRRTTAYAHSEKRPISCSRLELGFEQGVASASVADPQVYLEISKDWGRTWSSRRVRSMGKVGEYNEHAVWRRNGVSRSYVFRWTVTDDVDVVFTSAYGVFNIGTG